MTSADTLLAAARIIRTRGWHQGGTVGPDGSVCAVEAIRLAGGHVFDAVMALERVTHCGAGWWNDQPERTAEQVIATLEVAGLEAAVMCGFEAEQEVNR